MKEGTASFRRFLPFESNQGLFRRILVCMVTQSAEINRVS
jgi:hypothetical protein